VQSALVEAIGVANLYPEFLPERLRGLIAAHIGVGENQVVLGAGATGDEASGAMLLEAAVSLLLVAASPFVIGAAIRAART